MITKQARNVQLTGQRINSKWTVKELGMIATFLNGKAFNQNELFGKGKYRVLRVGNFFTSSDWYYSDLELEESKYVEDGDLMYAWSASFGPRFWSGQRTIYHYHIWKVLPTALVTKEYLFYFLDYDTQRLLNNKQGGTMFHVTKGDMEKRKIPLPPLPEQRKIALILSAWDRAIEKTEQLIAQKQKLKKGLMQQLLTGKVRFREFKNQHIKSAVLGDVVSFSGGSQPPRSNFKFEDAPGYVRLVQNRDYKSDRFKTYIPEDSVSKRCDKTDIMIGRYGPPLFQIFRGIEGAYNVALIKAVPDEKQLLKEYCWYFLNRPELQKYIEGFSQRSGGQTGIEMDRLNSYPLNIPSILEQKRIIEVLSSIDLQIIKMLRELEILKAQKKGLMQRLLTGKVRVKH